MEKLIQIITEMIRRRQWQRLMTVVRGLMEFDSSLYLKRNRNAVERVKEAFARIHGKPAYPAQSTTFYPHHWDKQLAVIVDATGVAPLIDDMKASVNYYPESIFYYIHSLSNKTPRWDLLMYDEIRRHEQEDKDLWNIMSEAYEELTRTTVKAVDPEWVVKARRRWEELAFASKTLRGTNYLEATREMQTIEVRLRNQGYSIKKED
jgi:hypothetical protein